MLTDHDFHPEEPRARVFRTPAAGVLRLDDDVAVSEAVHDGLRQDGLLPWLGVLARPGLASLPGALSMCRGPVPGRLQLGARRSW